MYDTTASNLIDPDRMHNASNEQFNKGETLVTGIALHLDGFAGTEIRLDLLNSKLYLASALSYEMVAENFYANKVLKLGVITNEGIKHFLEMILDSKGLQIEDLEASASDTKLVHLELVADIASYRYLSAENLD